MKLDHSNSQFNQALLATYTDPNLSGLIFGFIKMGSFVQPGYTAPSLKFSVSLF